MPMFSTENKKIISDRYTNRYLKYGYDPKTLGWDKGKQISRYFTLLSGFNLEGKKILDIGCGFGDGIKVIKHFTSNFEYLGIDIVDCLIDEAKSRYTDDNIKFISGDFLAIDDLNDYDIVIGSGIFNFKLLEQDNYDFISNVLNKSYSICNDGIAFDFLSNKVSYELENTFHSDPSVILSKYYELTNNIELINSVMPFEFSVIASKKDKFEREDTLFESYKQSKEFQICLDIEKESRIKNQEG
ncbi:class I SAM-dependent methyltransferase [Aliivibrio fischeri]|uniref:SAM-dependent methyltransferase n=1 Tax=Aliivibrio fischeri TaxID=668 RepID=A0A510UKA4_ALIFS|nr:class I SAM-dependent methyltransferase [Aliivibrio fischeri]MUL16622.1 methyltransferase domain-containing protein [Aliivibrio fischeri]GEK15072.1 SAM-dependent methyltransferase [Aliivibrio fischeri]